MDLLGPVLVSVVCVALLELLARAVPRFQPAGSLGLRRDANGVALGPPGATRRHARNTGDFVVTVRYNRQGLRDGREPGDAPAGAIFVVGDSFSFGWGVEAEDRYGERLEAMSGVPVLNLAAPCDVAGYGRQLALGRRHGAEVGRVVAGLCMERDVKRYGDAPPPDPQPSPLMRVKTWLTRHSALYSAFTSIVHGTPALRPLARRLGLMRDPLETKLRPYDPEAVKSTVETLVQALSGVDAVVLLIPSRALWHGDRREDAERTHAAVAAALEARGLGVADPREAFEATGHPLAFHFPIDPHWAASGHRVAAEILCRTVTARGWAATPRSEP